MVCRFARRVYVAGVRAYNGVGVTIYGEGLCSGGPILLAIKEEK